MRLRACAVSTRAVFTPEQPNFEPLYWSSLSAVLSCLNISVEGEIITEEWSAVLCQLTRLERLKLFDVMYPTSDTPVSQGILKLNLPQLEGLSITRTMHFLHLICPKLEELTLTDVDLKSIRGMPSSIQKVRLALARDSVPLQDVLPAESVRSLEKLAEWPAFHRR